MLQIWEVVSTVIFTNGSRMDILFDDFKKREDVSKSILGERKYSSPKNSTDNLKFKKLYKNIPHSSIHSSTLLVFSKRIGLILEAVTFVTLVVYFSI